MNQIFRLLLAACPPRVSHQACICIKGSLKVGKEAGVTNHLESLVYYV
jgi:hypothetical protein